MMTRLDALIEGLDLRVERGPAAPTLTDLVEDSRQASPGCAFLARTGTAADGRAFIHDALQRGATAVITDTAPPADLADDVAWVRAEQTDVRLAATLAERFFDHPSRELRLIGVTGTNGKTTTATLIQHLLNTAGLPTGVIGTLGANAVSSAKSQVSSSHGGEAADSQPETWNLKLETNLTTPGPIDFSRILAKMRDHGCRAVVTEVSSHALEQGRVDALQFDVAVFTNLTGDHLDYHGTMDAYAAAKARLFALLAQSEHVWAVVNADDPYATTMLETFAGPASHVLRCSLNSDAPATEDHAEDQAAPQCRAAILELTADTSRARFDGPWGSVEAALPLVGRHNIANALHAAAAAHAVTDLTRTIRRALAHCPPVPGRLERVPSSRFQVSSSHTQPAHESLKLPAVLVDYAHTHDALENVLLALRPLTQGRLLLVFGCGGDRDREKRPKMAQVACRFADAIWITADNPRTEDSQRIIDDIRKGVSKPETASIQPDRARAIREAILAAGPDDTVLIAGKGHEDYQILGREKIHFDDREHAAAALTQWQKERSAPCPPTA